MPSLFDLGNVRPLTRRWRHCEGRNAKSLSDFGGLGTCLLNPWRTRLRANDVGDDKRAHPGPAGRSAPAITVSVTGHGTGVSRTALTDTDGLFVLSNLPPGVVDLVVMATGFAEISRRDLVLEVGRTYSFDFRLTIGSVTERVDVRNIVSVDTSRSVVDAVISTNLIDALPLNGRNFLELALLVPGNAPAPTSIRRRRNSVSISSAGQLGRGGNIIIDGTDDNDDVVGGPLQNISQEAVQEFQIATNRFTAELGRSAVVGDQRRDQVRERQLHGSASLFLRDSAGRHRRRPSTNRRRTIRRSIVSSSPVALGGPLVQGKLFGSAAGEYRNQDGAVLVGARDVRGADDPALLCRRALDDLLASVASTGGRTTPMA